MSRYDNRGFMVLPEAKPIDCTAHMLANLKVTFDPETGSTQPDESDLIDLDALTQSYADQCGMDLALKAIKQGQKTLDDFRDKGDASGSVPPELMTAQGRANAALAAKANAETLADQLGVPKGVKLTEDQLTAIISKTISEKYPDIIKKTEVKTDE